MTPENATNASQLNGFGIDVTNTIRGDDGAESPSRRRCSVDDIDANKKKIIDVEFSIQRFEGSADEEGMEMLERLKHKHKQLKFEIAKYCLD